ncbi:MAG: 4-hydroxy-tetrahydrodipicolinate synthase [Tepidanaerobacter acetatoxydans]|jgi:4-hydroxy-tetrahydrodipicolinate synthase|uniref:4-hydroxy-tetrahydrodipicolinate synthase n=1 Tax=Tepidanaerobacter TaxID=499228 RepID=UPI000A9DB315|nr:MULTISPECIES: 4-hydroxy-tetrahydrodipicolinate synthase [Tepidanaerobacter]NLU11134.1 4-hydroxy-tetrahydrodipicolinate synthase [Tepidanaerobacter acetatoxydans]
MIFGKVITAMVTPFDEELNIDYKALENLIEHLLATGTDTLLVAGTTGESPTLTDEEKLDLFKACKEIAGKRAKIMAGTGSNSTLHSIELSQKAEKVGADSLLLVSPYYNKPTQEGLYRHFKAIAEAVDIPVVPYNVPGRTAVTIEPETLARLSEIKNVVAVKDAVGNLDKTSKTRLLAPNLEIYSGDDSLTLPMLALGAQGVISVASHVVGSEIKQMITSFEEGNTKKAEEIHLKLFNIFKALFVITNPIPVKAALNLIGIRVGGLRLPLCEADDNTIAALKKALSELGKLG